VPTNNFSQNGNATRAPYTRAVAVTPSDTVDLTEVSRGLNVHSALASCPVKVMMQGDTVAVILQLQTGFIYPLRVSRVYATGTTATTVVALY